MNDSLPNVDEVQEISDTGLQQQQKSDAEIISRHKREIGLAIRRSIGELKYNFYYHFDDDMDDRILNRLCKWIKEQPGYRAKKSWSDYDYHSLIIIKIPRKRSSGRWPFFLRWIPGLG